MPGAGAYDRRIIIKLKTDATLGSGELVPNWDTTRAEVWAKKRDVRGQERFRANQDLATRTAVWELREYRADVVETDRLIDDQGVTWNITGLAEIGRRERLEIAATATNP